MNVQFHTSCIPVNLQYFEMKNIILFLCLIGFVNAYYDVSAYEYQGQAGLQSTVYQPHICTLEKIESDPILEKDDPYAHCILSKIWVEHLVYRPSCCFRKTTLLVAPLIATFFNSETRCIYLEFPKTNPNNFSISEGVITKIREIILRLDITPHLIVCYFRFI